MNCDKCHEPIDYLEEAFYFDEETLGCVHASCIAKTEPHTIIEELKLCVA